MSYVDKSYHLIWYMTSHYSSFTRSKNKERNRTIKVENKKDLNKERETKKK